MSEKYYREINSNKDIVKFELQLGAILLKLNEHNLNISNIKDEITKINTDIKNNDKDIKANYDICVSNKNSLIDIDRKIYATNSNITNINSNMKSININITNINSDIENIEESNKNNIKHNYAIENIWFYDIDILNVYITSKSKPSVILYEKIIESKFTVNSILEISCNILYDYVSYDHRGLLKHKYSLLDVNNNLIQTYNIIHTNSGDNLTNYLTMNDNFSFLFKDSHTDKLKIELQVGVVDVNRSISIGFRILNPYRNNILRVKYLKHLSEK